MLMLARFFFSIFFFLYILRPAQQRQWGTKKSPYLFNILKQKNGWMNLDPFNFEMFLPDSFFFILDIVQKTNKIERKGRDLEIFFGVPCWWFRSMFVASTLHINRRHEIDKQKKKRSYSCGRESSPLFLLFFHVYIQLLSAFERELYACFSSLLRFEIYNSGV